MTLVLVEGKEDAVRVDHYRRLMFGRAATGAAPARQPFYLWPKTKVDSTEEPDAQRQNHQQLHAFRWRKIAGSGPQPIAFGKLVLVEGEHDAVRTNHSLRMMFGRVAPAAPAARQPIAMWRKPVVDMTEAPFERTVNNQLLNAFRSPAATASIGFCWFKSTETPRQDIEEDATRIDHSRLLRFRVRGLVSHDSSGAVVGHGASVTGSAARIGAAVNHATSGVVRGAGAVVVGNASIKVTHATSGVIVGAAGGARVVATGQNGASLGGDWIIRARRRTRR